HLVRRFADRVAVMERGVLVEQGTVAEVFAAPAHAYTRRLLGSVPRRDVIEDVVEDVGMDADSAPAAGAARAEPPAASARGLRVAYATPLPGLRGWFRRGEFVAV
ncbi:microcin ABC transporter ATP-binding protein, partial [Azospirillum brasilense]